ncbi:MAG: hypothetical protein IPL61_14695 [Myxococcales bacterium]|nr:hypothetical protein [Myxococcales bacterium]
MVRAAASLVLVAAVVAVGAAAGGDLGGAVAAAAVVLVAVTVRFLFARFAHAMFRAGRMVEARRYYRVLAVAAWRRRRRAAARVSIAATHIGVGDYRRGLALLAELAPDDLDPATRAGWLNNRAYANLRTGATGAAAEAALADARAALALYVDVPALLHTEALALYACGRVDDAIAAWEALWERAELTQRLDAERCDDLAAAWAGRGEGAYAADYRRRALASAAAAPWRPADVELVLAAPPVE